MKRLNIGDCLVCVLDRRICIFGLFVFYLSNVFEVVCKEFEKKNENSFGINFKFIRNLVLFVDRSYFSISLFILVFLNVIFN